MSTLIDTRAALDYFTSHDEIMAQLLAGALHAPDSLSIPQTKQPEQYFSSIVSAIVGQQISTKAADAVRSRLLVAAHGTFTPVSILSLSTEELRACGLSGQKVRYITECAARWHEIPIENFAYLPDEEIITQLVTLPGVGRWTAEMFLIFSLARPNIFSYGDLGLMQSLCKEYNYHPHYRCKITQKVDSWSPHKTAASLTLWHWKDNGPVLLEEQQ